jgi:glycosyltransferase involved in cell wall biosynthesis
MRVAFLHTAYGAMGGAEVLSLAQARLLAESGWDLSVVCFGFQESPWRGHLGPSPVISLPRRHWRDLLALGEATKWGPRFRRAQRVLGDFDAVVAHGQPLAAHLGAWSGGPRSLWYCHEPPWRRFPDRVDYTLLRGLPETGEEAWLAPFRRAREQALEGAAASGLQTFERAGTLRLNGLAANSAFGRRALEACYGRSDIAVIPPLVRFPTGVPRRQGLRRGGLQVLTLARLETLKNVEGLLRGFALYARRAPGAHLHVVGEGRERPRLEELVRTWGLLGQVTFHGFLDPVADQDRLEAVFAAADVFALLPLDESFGLVFPEAAARGLLLLGPDHGGPLEILEGGALGPCLPVFQPERLAEAFEELEALPDAEADRRRVAAESACRARYAPAAVLPQIQAWIQGSA